MCKVAKVSFQLSKGNAGRGARSFVRSGTSSGAILYSPSAKQFTHVSGRWMSQSCRRIQCLPQQRALHRNGAFYYSEFSAALRKEDDGEKSCGALESPCLTQKNPQLVV